MTRSNGKFPVYRKLDIDTVHSPEDFLTTGARRCLKCDVNWPNYKIWERCPRDGSVTRAYFYEMEDDEGLRVMAHPDMEWREAVHELLELQFEKLYENWNEGQGDLALLLITPTQTEDELQEEFRRLLEGEL